MARGIDEILMMLFGEPKNDMGSAKERADSIYREDAKEVWEMGKLCYQLGLVPDDIPRMARYYLALQMFDDLDVELNYLSRVIRETRRD